MSETRPYDNSATQDERKAIVRNDTYFSRQSNAVDDAGGRYAKLTPNILTGQTQQVPRLPENSPWHHDPVPATQPLGFSVDAMEPVGTQAEIEASIEPALEPNNSSALPADVADRAGEPVGITSFLVPAGSTTFKRRVW